LTRVAVHLRTPLYKSSYALVASAAGTAILGLLYWSVATRDYPAREVGVQSVVISTMLFLAGLSQLSLNSALIRFLPVLGNRSGRVIVVTYAISATAGLVAAAAFVIGTPLWSPKLTFLRDDWLWFAGFLVGTSVWCVFSLQDSVLAGLRRAPWVPVENIGVSLAKIGLVVFFASRLIHSGLFASWIVPAAIAVIGVNTAIYLKALPGLEPTQHSDLHTLRSFMRFAGGNYVGFVFYAASSNLLPLVVLNRTGAADAAYFFLPWAITSALLLVATSTSTAFTVEAARDLPGLLIYGRRALSHTLALLAVPVALFFFAGPTLLRAFGHGYAAHGGNALRFLSLGVLPNAVVLVGLGVLRVRGRLMQLAGVQALACAIVLGGSYLALPRYGITSVGVAFVVSQVAAAVALLAGDLRGMFRAASEVD
jgi:O-antigen/teichoic acid export membrane protein